ncbi:MAG: hypothetical protein IPL62_03125 [Caulobacteraceae bacterium]|nr:hypothetical protein [Caulobacteraceae bacterium]
MKDVAIVSYCRTGIAKATRGALNQTHGIAMAAHVMKEAGARQARSRTSRLDPPHTGIQEPNFNGFF